MITILVSALIFFLVIGLIYWITTLFPLPPPLPLIINVIMVVIVVVWLINLLLSVGGMGGYPLYLR